MSRGAVYVGETPEGELVTLPYDIAYLLFVAPDFPGVEMNVPFHSGGEGVDGGFSFGDDFGGDDDSYAPEDLVDMIQSTVDPLVWERDDVAIRLRGTTLMVTAPGRTHQVLRHFLRTLEY